MKRMRINSRKLGSVRFNLTKILGSRAAAAVLDSARIAGRCNGERQCHVENLRIPVDTESQSGSNYHETDIRRENKDQYKKRLIIGNGNRVA